MAFIVSCPQCGMRRQAGANNQVKCSSCGCTFAVGSSGEIKWSRPGRK